MIGVVLNMVRSFSPLEGKHGERIATVDIGGHDLKVYMTGGSEPDSYEVIPTDLRGAMLETGDLDVDAYQRTVKGLGQAATAIKNDGTVETRATTCSAGRGMSPSALARLEADVQGILGTDLVVVPGDMEAELGFYGALSCVGARTQDQRVVTVDVGGGSTELAVGTLSRGVSSTVSMPVGGSSLKIAVNGETFDVESVEHTIDDYIAEAGDLSVFKWEPGTMLVIIGGIAGTLSAWTRDAKTTDPHAMDGEELLVEDLAPAGRMFFRLTPEEMAESGCVIPGREDSIGYAGLVLSTIVEALDAKTVVVSSGGVAQALAVDANWKKLLASVREPAAKGKTLEEAD